MADPVSIAAAFGAGVLSCVAPCTLALIPGYVSYLAGFTLPQGAASPARARLAAITNTLAFATGFTAVFVLLGAALGAVSQSLTGFGPWLNRASGILIIAFGLVALGLWKPGFLARGFTVRWAPANSLRYLGSMLVGATFAVGWTPCVGPVLGAVFALAGTTGSAGQGALLLTSYSTGLMLPFVAAGAVAGWSSRLLQRHGRWLSFANQAAGALLLALGVALFTGLLPVLSSYLALGA